MPSNYDQIDLVFCIKSLVDARKIVVPADTYIWHRKAFR